MHPKQPQILANQRLACVVAGLVKLACFGFDSHALPPLTNLNASRVFPKARLRQVRSPRSNQIRPVSPCAVRFRHMSGTWKVLVPRQRGITGHNQRTAAGPDRSGTGSCRQFDHPGALLLLAHGLEFLKASRSLIFVLYVHLEDVARDGKHLLLYCAH